MIRFPATFRSCRLPLAPSEARTLPAVAGLAVMQGAGHDAERGRTGVPLFAPLAPIFLVRPEMP